ncbi:MAG: glycosyltransferase [Microcoleaceae cyanobacterium]
MIYWITVNYYSTQYIERLINSIVSQSQLNYQIIIVNNSVDDDLIHQFASDKILIIDSPHNLGFGDGCNIGLNWVYQRDKNAIVWLINPDTVLPQNAAVEALKFTQQNPHLSIVGTLVKEANNTVSLGGGIFNKITGEILPKVYDKSLQNQSLITIDWISGCSMLINFNQFKNCPQYDSDYFLYYEDFDFCMRYRTLGHQLAITPNITVIHHPSSITNQYPNLKLEHQIYSYLLSLKKYASLSAFYYRFFRIISVSLIALLISPSTGLNKLKGVIRYLHWLFKN